MNPKRPINLNLWRLRFPIMAIASILHRISGVIIFLCLPLFLYLLQQSLSSETNFNQLTVFLAHPIVRLILWGSISAVLYHLFAGIRHLAMDLGFGESLQSGRFTAYFVIILSMITAILSGVWLWQL